MGWSLHIAVRMSRHIVLSFLILSACMPAENTGEGHEPEDFEVEPNDGKADGVTPVFDMNNVMTDALFEDAGSMQVEDVQAFFEHTPYRNRSWLASHTVNGVSAAQAVIDAAQLAGIHPLVLIARMQVESSIVSKTVKPSQRLIDRALGCGCPDGGGCNESFQGLARQLECGARTMRRWYDASIDGSGQWRMGVTRSTLDPKRVTPANHATASLYAYTPWVLERTGGTWLAWNVTRKYVRYAEAEGLALPQE
jgi:hypothetical protein